MEQEEEQEDRIHQVHPAIVVRIGRIGAPELHRSAQEEMPQDLQRILQVDPVVPVDMPADEPLLLAVQERNDLQGA